MALAAFPEIQEKPMKWSASWRHTVAVLVAGVIALSAAANPVAAATGEDPASPTRTYVVPGDRAFPESVAVDPVTGYFYVSGAGDGTVYRGRPGQPELKVWLPGGADGRTMSQGLKLDGKGRLYVAGGLTGQMWVYDTRDRSLVRRFDTGLRSSTFINDLAFDRQGNAYFTDSFAPVLWRVPAKDVTDDEEPGSPERFLDFDGTAVRYAEGMNLNGILLDSDGRSMITVQSNTGKLYRIWLADRTVSEIAVQGGALTAGGGITRVGDRVLITRNVYNEIVTLKFGAAEASVTHVYKDATFHYPSAAVVHRGDVLVPNNQFDKWVQGPPDLPFTVSSVPLAKTLGSTPSAHRGKTH